MSANTYRYEDFWKRHKLTVPRMVFGAVILFLASIFQQWVQECLHNEKLRTHFIDQQIKNLVIEHNSSNAPCFLKVSTLTKEQLTVLTDRWPSWQTFKLKHPEDCKDPEYPIKELF